MDRNVYTDDLLGRMPFARTYDQLSTVPTSEIAHGTDLTHDDGSQSRGRTARVPDTYSTTESDHFFGGYVSRSSMPARTERAVSDQSLVHANLGQYDSLSCHPTSEWDDSTDRQQSGHRLLEERDPDDMSQPAGQTQGTRQNSGTIWLPFCLRKTTSLLFMVGFALMATILETLFVVAQRNSGLSHGTPSLRYLWSYGTTGILTLTAALWHRLDYETKVSAPWLRAYPITTSKAALLVDYINAWSLLVPFRALRNRDYQVVYSSTISLLLQVLIVLSTALFILAPTNIVNDAEPVFLKSRFVDDPARLKNSESLLPYYITMGVEFSTGNLSKITDAHSTYPEGCSSHFAYQTFDPVSSSLEEVETTVHGLALGLVCETANVGKRVTMPQIVYIGDGDITTLQGDGPYLEVNYQGCQTTIDWDIFTPYANVDWVQKVQSNKAFREHGMMLRGIPGFARDQCNSTDQRAHRLVFLSAEVEWRPNNQSIIYEGLETVGVSIDATVSQSVALVCNPSLEQTLLDVSQNSGGVQSVSRHSGDPPDLLSVIQPWDFIDFFFEKDIILQTTDGAVVGNTTVWADIHSKVVLGFCGQSCLGTPGLLKDTTLLQSILATFLASYAATTAHTMLTERVNITSTGTSSSIPVRLWVKPIVCQAMVALLALLILIIVGFQFEQRKKLTRKINPGTIAATAVLAGQAASSNFPKGLGLASTEKLHEALAFDGFLDSQRSSSSHPLHRPSPMEEGNPSRASTKARPASSRSPVFQNPLPLQPVSHTALILTIVACGTTLMVLLRKSADEQGLGDTAGSRYLLFAWTTVPATIMTIISWWLSTTDTQVRLLAPYRSLKHKTCSRSILRMDLLRGLIPLVLYQELKASDFAAVSTTLAALLGATLTTVSSPTFHVITYPVSSPIELSQNTVFMTPTPRSGVVIYHSDSVEIRMPSYDETSRLSSLILETNLSYSQGSYQDLVFPRFSLTPPEIENTSHMTNSSSATIKVTAPALRPRLSCRVYSPSDIAAVYVRNQTVLWGQQSRDSLNGVVVNVPKTTQEPCNRYPLFDYASAVFETGNLSEFMFAGVSGGNQAETIAVGGCSASTLYIWGYHNATTGPVTNTSVVGCNDTVELVDATFSLMLPDLKLDLAHAPEAIESTVRDFREVGFLDQNPSFGFYKGLASLPIANDNIFDSFFRQLVTSRYAIPISAIGDPTQADVVMDAIRLQHGIIEAQFLGSNYRVDMDSPDVTENATAVLNPTLFDNSTSSDSARYSATVTYPFGRSRVVQDPTATTVLEVLLLSILILLILGWCLGSSEPVLPRSLSSVGSILGLLAGGNVLEHLYDGDSEPLCWDDVKTRLGKDSKFYLGWDPSNTNEDFERRRFGIWIIKKNGRSTFGPRPATTPE